mmetsp:Transcript_33439/g.77117  ORF Transcript_33439/g.77117 Transcript_33439/m.77117 type:complete len:234 (-) Transcript_33439:417-1118(-)|eukprot:CAMPEP_0113298090 /NCGR_PEP_ID=MMETSP0010_2-20120614/678_1 /TAXON_ID=216773 ORGANISM="Corethron hystrix, Strain 308" /NCGR_SAMPLE_ID=MMETSP0010_2 /ASSEMBLY_ACC=CAM_ASM_000155 /LENGTH=233 /DNA_ID=CAMNT_0000151083 /DNA_START=23 /DNA_END=724 /DNA_ORIENTATION=+ /assembly_acc=CAM_ASM_000155
MSPHDGQKPKCMMGEIDKAYLDNFRAQYQSGPFSPFDIGVENDNTGVNSSAPVATSLYDPNLALKAIYEGGDSFDSFISLKRTDSNITSGTKRTTGMTSLATQKYSNVKNPTPKLGFGMDGSFDEDSVADLPPDSFYNSFDFFCCAYDRFGMGDQVCGGSSKPEKSKQKRNMQTLEQQQRRALLLEKRRRRFQAFAEQQRSYKMNATPRGFEFDEFQHEKQNFPPDYGSIILD